MMLSFRGKVLEIGENNVQEFMVNCLIGFVVTITILAFIKYFILIGFCWWIWSLKSGETVNLFNVYAEMAGFVYGLCLLDLPPANRK